MKSVEFSIEKLYLDKQNEKSEKLCSLIAPLVIGSSLQFANYFSRSVDRKKVFSKEFLEFKS